jgi:hypothetical protein
MKRTITTLLILAVTLSGCGNKLITSNLGTSKSSLRAKTQTAQSSFEKIQGKWQSTDDKTNFLVFEKDHRKDFADGMEKWDDEVFVLGDKCLNDLDKDREIEPEKDKYISCIKSDLCWYIVEVNSSGLSLSYMGRGNTLTYKKVK